MAYKMEDYDNDRNQQMHSILDRGFNNLRQSFERSSNYSVNSSRQSPSLRKKSQIRQVLDDMKSNASSMGTYNEDGYGHYNPHMISGQFKENSSINSNMNIPTESPMKTEIKNKRAEMQNELTLLQKKIQGLEEKFVYSMKDSGRI